MKKQINSFHWIKSVMFFLFLFLLSNVKAQLVNSEIVDSIYIIFDFGKSKINNQSQLIEQLNKIDFGKTGKVVLKAYTDSVGSVQYNKKLASKRLFETTKLIKNSKLKSLALDSLNLNENQNTVKVNDEQKRRVDIIVYSTSSNFKLKIPIVLNIAFQGNKAELVGEDENEDLAELLRIMKSDPLITIKLNGHVAVSPDQELSINRALRIKNYVIKAGVSEKRITCEGFSNSKPLIPNAKIEEEHAKNRRVEVIFYK